MNLLDLGLRAGDRVRYRRRPDQRWREAVVVQRERDGSVGLRDAKGASLAIRAEQIEVRTAGPRGGPIWEPVVDRTARVEQLDLFRDIRHP